MNILYIDLFKLYITFHKSSQGMFGLFNFILFADC